MKFAHLADIHLGAWRDPKLRELSSRAFSKAVSNIIDSEVDFVILAGDLFNTSIPPIDTLKHAVSELSKLRKRGVPVYTIAGSHDFSPTGKTMLEVLEEAGLIKNVCKGSVVSGLLRLRFLIDPKTGVKITGMIGKRGMLEKEYYQDLDREYLEKEPGKKLFVFHTAISELKPKELERMESSSISLLPKGFDYYAGGHVHIVKEANIGDYKNVVYPGPTFPNSFFELEQLNNGGLYICSDTDKEYFPIPLARVEPFRINCDNKTPDQVSAEIEDALQTKDVRDAIVLLRLYGTLSSGRTTDIDFKKVISSLYSKGVVSVLKNTSKLNSKEFEELKVVADTSDQIEELAIKEHCGQVNTLGIEPSKESSLIKDLMSALEKEKLDGEKQGDYDSRILGDVNKIVDSTIPR